MQFLAVGTIPLEPFSYLSHLFAAQPAHTR